MSSRLDGTRRMDWMPGFQNAGAVTPNAVPGHRALRGSRGPARAAISRLHQGCCRLVERRDGAFRPVTAATWM